MPLEYIIYGLLVLVIIVIIARLIYLAYKIIDDILSFWLVSIPLSFLGLQLITDYLQSLLSYLILHRG